MCYLTEKSKTAFFWAILIKCFVAVVFILCVLAMLMWPLQKKALRVRRNTLACTSSLVHLYQALTYDRVVFPNVRVSDLIQEALRNGVLNEKDCCCIQNGRPYLVFSVDASVLSPFENQRIPIIMDYPDSHMEEAFIMRIFRVMNPEAEELSLTARVLYSDGCVRVLSKEEAERLMYELSPRPIMFNVSLQPGTS